MKSTLKIHKDDLGDLDRTLAEVIYRFLIEFKKLNRTDTIYSHRTDSFPDVDSEYWSDDTEWFLDELIYTFKTISKGLDPEVKKLIKELDLLSKDQDNVKEEEITAKEDEILKTNQESRARITMGLELFSRYFRHLWE